LNIGPNNLTSQTLVSLAGIAIMAMIAGLLARFDQTGNAHPRTL